MIVIILFVVEFMIIILLNCWLMAKQDEGKKWAWVAHIVLWLIIWGWTSYVTTVHVSGFTEHERFLSTGSGEVSRVGAKMQEERNRNRNLPWYLK